MSNISFHKSSLLCCKVPGSYSFSKFSVVSLRITSPPHRLKFSKKVHTTVSCKIPWFHALFLLFWIIVMMIYVFLWKDHNEKLDKSGFIMNIEQHSVSLGDIKDSSWKRRYKVGDGASCPIDLKSCPTYS